MLHVPLSTPQVTSCISDELREFNLRTHSYSVELVKTGPVENRYFSGKVLVIAGTPEYSVDGSG